MGKKPLCIFNFRTDIDHNYYLSYHLTMIRPYILAETNWKTLKDQEIDIAILPWGATEAHNLHLPFATDIIESEVIAAQAAGIAWDSGVKVIVLPAIPFGVNTGQLDVKLNINMNPSTQAAILKDILDNMRNHKIKKFLIVNSHGGNDFKQMIRELGVKYPEMFLASCNWWQSLDKLEFFDKDGDHADEMETSILMHLHPELVLPLDEAGEGKEKHFKLQALNEKWAWAERKWMQVTEDTGIGNPKNATAEKGEKYLKVVTQKVAELITDMSQADLDDLYE